MIENIIGELLTPFAVFGGIALLVWTSAKAKLEHRKLDLMAQSRFSRLSQTSPS